MSSGLGLRRRRKKKKPDSGARLVPVEIDGDAELVDRAHVGDGDAPFADMTSDRLEPLIDVHLKGSYNVCRATIEHFREQNEGAYVLFTSTSGNGNQYLSTSGSIAISGNVLSNSSVTLTAAQNVAATGLVSAAHDVTLSATTGSLTIGTAGTTGSGVYAGGNLTSSSGLTNNGNTTSSFNASVFLAIYQGASVLSGSFGGVAEHRTRSRGRRAHP